MTTSTPSTARLDARHAAERAETSAWTRHIAQIGLVARAVLFATLGILVLEIAFGRDRRRVDSNGALHAIAGEPFGRALLVLLAVGFAAYALWRLIEAITPHPGREHDALVRLADAGRVALYALLCGLTVAILFGSHRTGGNAEQGWTARVLGWPGGRYLVAAVGVAVIVGAIVNARHVFDGSWRRDIDTGRLGPGARRAVGACAAAGLIGRALVFAAIGVFLIQAAIDYNPDTGVGLDGALHRLAHATFGPLILVLVAVGMFAYAVYSVCEALLRRSAES